MFIAVCKLQLDIHAATSIKEKRNILRSIKQRTRGDFNISIAETDYLDTIQQGELTAAAVSNNSRYLNGLIDKMVDSIERRFPGLIADYSLLIENYEEP